MASRVERIQQEEALKKEVAVIAAQRKLEKEKKRKERERELIKHRKFLEDDKKLGRARNVFKTLFARTKQQGSLCSPS